MTDRETLDWIAEQYTPTTVRNESIPMTNNAPEQQADLAVTVKPLVWVKDDDGEYSTQSPFHGVFGVFFDVDYGWLCYRDGSLNDDWVEYPDDDEGFPTAESAIAYVDGWHEKRIKSALDLTPTNHQAEIAAVVKDAHGDGYDCGYKDCEVSLGRFPDEALEDYLNHSGTPTAALQAREDAVKREAWNEARKEVLDDVNIRANDENTRSDLEHAIIALRKEVK